MTFEPLTVKEHQLLLDLARRSVRAAASGAPLPEVVPADFTPALMEEGASFVTLTEMDGELRGCIGALEAYQPLALDVRTHAAAAAVEDYRFPRVRPEEVDRLKIEISRLTRPESLGYTDSTDLIRRLCPGLDGVILRDSGRRATFLPQVWKKIPRVEEFLNQLCRKMGAPADLWRRKHIEVLVYQVEEFHD
jgi:AmmeMemoRadiSam system protein A